ncbi:hypothetical protein MtrunA17_Chr5g0417331 [Medicago truncatula]|uniref:Uncharacterized protein n=1 Tax=Medicago truncatula TaxID=3880 RepID=A0A396HXF7_MEDTR|nr:hypothetical protein MtrunA17_Chr5g0417331 [Medicago truncatula]
MSKDIGSSYQVVKDNEIQHDLLSVFISFRKSTIVNCKPQVTYPNQNHNN